MLVFGTKAKHLKTDHAGLETCTHCGTQGRIQVKREFKYVHFFWIPMFPYKEVLSARCEKCKSEWSAKEMTPGLLVKAKNLKTTAKTPLWSYTGSILLIFLVVWGVLLYSAREKQRAALLAEPRPRDQYFFKTPTDMYSIFWVDSCSTDSLYVRYNEHEVIKPIKSFKINKPEHFNTPRKVISRQEVQKQFDAGDIYSINRP